MALAMTSMAARGPAGSDYLVHQQSFLEALASVRGCEPLESELREAASKLCSLYQRCDVERVAEYYLALSPDERRAGLEAEHRFNALWQRVRDAESQGLQGWSWSAELERVLRELDELAALARPQADFVPAARALSLSARLLVQRAENDGSLTDGELEEILRTAEQHASEAIELFDRAEHIGPRCEASWVLGRLAILRDETGLARRLLAECLEDARLTRNDDFREHALSSLAQLARHAGDLVEEERLLVEIARFRGPEQSWPLALDYARRLAATDHADQALEFLERHRPKADAPPASHADWHRLMTSIALLREDPDQAREHLAELAEQQGTQLQILAEGRLNLIDGAAEKVVERFATPHWIDTLTRRGQVEAHSLLGEAFLALGKPLAAIDEFDLALELTDLWAAHLAAEHPVAGEGGLGLVGEWVGLHTVALLARAHVECNEPLEAARVVEEYQSRSLRGAAARSDPEPSPASKNSTGLSTENLAAWARTTELGLISWVIAPRDTIAVYVAPDGSASALHSARGRSDMREAVRRLREASFGGSIERTDEISAEILEEIFPPALLHKLESQGESAAESRLLLLAHGPLEALPFPVLRWRGRSIDQMCTPLVLPGLPSRESSPAGKRELGRWSLLGAPVIDGAGGAANDPLPLPGAERELKALAGLYRDAALEIGPRFDAARLGAALRSDGPVHIATHLTRGCECAGLRLSPLGLLLSHGESLCAHRLAALKPALPLVVLSACETAGGDFVDAEGLQGLARAFLESGTRNLLVTLWPIEDREAESFALLFHRELLETGVPSRAARRARLHEQRRGQPPAAWAGFCLIGRD